MRRWDLFCSVVDNFGDIGVCWRLARQLANEHQAAVRLWVDNLDSFQRLCPSLSTTAASQHVGEIEVRHWTADFPDVEVADVVIEAFACELPASYVRAMNERKVAPVWINLEYLSAEEWVEDCHLLPSPQARSTLDELYVGNYGGVSRVDGAEAPGKPPAAGLKKYFFFPGFTPKTGGLIRERDLLSRQATFDSAAEEEFWRSLKLPASGAELRVSLFCYHNPALIDLLSCWSESVDRVRLFVSPGPATQQVAAWFGEEFPVDRPLERGRLAAHAVPFLSQADYDRLLWSCDVNFVRGEDSFVRAQWGQRPFVWQIYPQTEDAHLVKLDAFLARYLGDYPHAASVRDCWRAWNGVGDIKPAWRAFSAVRESINEHGKDWARQLDQGLDLANNLVRFVSGQ